MLSESPSVQVKLQSCKSLNPNCTLKFQFFTMQITWEMKQAFLPIDPALITLIYNFFCFLLEVVPTSKHFILREKRKKKKRRRKKKKRKENQTIQHQTGESSCGGFRDAAAAAAAAALARGLGDALQRRPPVPASAAGGRRRAGAGAPVPVPLPVLRGGENISRR